MGWERGDWYENSLFTIFDTTQTHILPRKGPNMEFLTQNFKFNVQSLGKTEAIILLNKGL